MSRPLLAVAGAALALAASLTGVTATPAHADPPRPPTTYCNPSVDGQWIGVISATVQPVVTQFDSLNVTPGTTGSRTHTLTRVATVTTTVNQRTEITAEAKALFVRVTATVGFEVQQVTSTTDTESTSMTWNFNSPGYYGMYKGIRRVSGEWAKWLCARIGPDRGVWLNAIPGGKGSYVTYEDQGRQDEGTVSCATAEPPGTVRHAARAKLNCGRAGRPA